jgi:hypothetical protein
MKKISPLLILILLSVLGFVSFYFCKNYLGPVLNQSNAIKNPDISTTSAEIKTDKKNTIEFANSALGLSFNYTVAWGETIVTENIGPNYLFSENPPVELETIFKEQNLGENFFNEFKAMSREEQASFLIKDKIKYDNFLNKEQVISFKNNEKITVHAFNQYFLDMSGYESTAPIQPIYLGNLNIDSSLCISADLYKQIKIKNFYLSDCEYLANNFLIIPGIKLNETASDTTENAFVVAIGNLINSQEYRGFLVEYNYKAYNNPGKKLLNLFGYSGYGSTTPEEIKDLNINACNANLNQSSPGSEKFTQFNDKIINDNLIKNFATSTDSILSAIPDLDKNVSSLISKKWQDELEKNNGKKFSDLRGANNFYPNYSANGALIDKINSYSDIEPNYYELNPNDLNCLVYKLEMLKNLNSFREDYTNNKDLAEFKKFVKEIQIN